MISAYASASSLSCLDMCEQKYFIENVLKMKDVPHFKAVKGTIVHKVLEILAEFGIKKRNQDETPVEDDKLGSVSLDISLQDLTKICYDKLHDENPKHSWVEEDLIDCFNWVKKAISMNRKQYDPRNLNVIDTEKFFDIEIDKPWAKYDFKLPDRILEGNLHIKGVIDLVIEDNNGIEILDWKTGQRLNWATGETKEAEYMEKDIQLLLYYYAAKQLYPNAKSYMSTIVYVNDGGAYSVDWNEKHLVEAERRLEEYFAKIKKITVPKLLWKEDPSRGYFCKRICPWGKGKCSEIYNDIVTIGMTGALLKHGDIDKLGKYSGRNTSN